MTVEPVRKKYYSNETMYGIYICAKAGASVDSFNSTYINIVGTMPELVLGKQYNMRAIFVNDPKWGEQYKVQSIYSDQPSTKEEEQNFIKALLTENQYNEIIKVYEYPVTAIINDEFDFEKVKGIGETTYDRIKTKVLENKELMKAIALFGQFGITMNQIKR